MGRRTHPIRWLLAVVFAVACAASVAAQAPQRPLRIAYVEREADPLYAVAANRDGVFRLVHRSPFPGAEVGVRDSLAGARAAGLAIELRRVSLADGASVAGALADLSAQGTTAAILDLGVEDLRAAAAAPAGLALVDIRSIDDGLRAETCAAPLVHVRPSRLQRTDALVQFLVQRNWRRILVLKGPEPEDQALADSIQTSARKFGARIVAVKSFAITNDPRRREETNVALLTGGQDFDALYIADSLGDAGRTMGFRINLPRPVVGPHGLDALGWSSYYERNGAPQLNRRFERAAGRAMEEEDWAAWVAVRSLVEAEAEEARRPTGAPLAARLLDPDLRLELYKGLPGSFRPWDRQLRQAMLLATHNAVVDLAPIEGFLHETNVLDTLGLLPRETPCGK
ncbi:amino acid ABC transporter substrate-binding protein [Alsobacter sp. SYSU M60028]|uniref:Amino acid ABC transporter substrate-binding protein n=1 Tax=Alsobacter ponti TaxID=2962936 RepID=A0ABT1L7V6_9HYPH|nr:amino acid ABC transporter substrate-binding protein [Alsobacter ponti]MCP8937575.1 amino acid ABC transporter substrate-binding protein [Alsobacter ponti]